MPYCHNGKRLPTFAIRHPQSPGGAKRRDALPPDWWGDETIKSNEEAHHEPRGRRQSYATRRGDAAQGDSGAGNGLGHGADGKSSEVRKGKSGAGLARLAATW